MIRILKSNAYPLRQIESQSTIGVTGLVMSGRGDLIYISIITKILQTYRDYRIVHQIVLHGHGEFSSLEGVQKITDLLIEEKLIKKQIYTGKTPGEIFESIYKSNPTMRILSDCDKGFSTINQQKVGNVFPEAMFWVHVSGLCDISYLTEKFIVFAELGNFEENSGTDYDYVIGLNASVMPNAKKACGFFFEDKNRVIEDFNEQAKALSKIKDHHLNIILHGETKPSLKKCKFLIAKTLIVHGYFTENLESMYVLLAAFCNSDYVKKSRKNIFISVNHTVERIELESVLNLDEVNLQIFTINPLSKKIKVTEETLKKNVITITFFCNHYYTRQDLNHLNLAVAT